MGRWMGVKWAVFAVALLHVSCGLLPHNRTIGSDINHFFTNARRREPTDAERNRVIRIPSCTAFFVENTKSQTIVATARHCFEFKETEFCDKGSGFTTNEGVQGRCLNVLAGDSEHDIVLFRAEFPFVPGPERTLRLSGFAPEVGTRLTMIGYPSDPERQGRLTVTDQCWVLQEFANSPYSAKKIFDESARHNCSTYGGNSGGPMLLEGSRIVVGLPFTFIPNDFTPYPADNPKISAHMARVADFVERHRTILTEAGVVAANQDEVHSAARPVDKTHTGLSQ